MASALISAARRTISGRSTSSQTGIDNTFSKRSTFNGDRNGSTRSGTATKCSVPGYRPANERAEPAAILTSASRINPGSASCGQRTTITSAAIAPNHGSHHQNAYASSAAPLW